MPFTLSPSNCEPRHTLPAAAGCERRLKLTTVVLLPALVLNMFLAPGAAASSAPSADTIRVATWNLEWLVSPQAFRQLKGTCTPEGVAPRGDVRQLPCDVTSKLERSSRDFSVLARYARELDADVIALQDTDGADAARLVFPDYEFCFTGRRHVQNTGFAVRRGIAFRCGPDDRELSLGDTLRRGKELTLFPGEPREIRLLSVHLKSGCSSKPLTAPDKACQELARQAPILEAWIDTQARAGRRFVVLGDFNRDLLSEQSHATTLGRGSSLWAEISDGAPPGEALRNAASGAAFRNCVPGQGYRGYIDNILLSRALAADAIPGSFSRLTYSAADARHARLSDHCPVSIRLQSRQKTAPAG
jgi:endonuclease/exonuclease/phosphatase family metal-dependent hydrolase